jgi:general secretion pathway protein K
VSRGRDGSVLLLVLWLVVALGVVASAVAGAARLAVSVSQNARAQLMARLAAESGLEATVARIEGALDSLAGLERQQWLNDLATRAVAEPAALGDGRYAVSVIDVSSRLDVNNASEASLRAFFARFSDLGSAARIARAIRTFIEAPLDSADSRLLPVPGGSFQPVRLLRSLDELREHGLVPAEVLQAALPYLTVDGDGTINRATAPDIVLAVASGELRDEPSRLLLISRGWLKDHPLTYEIQAVYAISGSRLALSHWREEVR